MTAHDVRALRVCRGCSQLGDGRDMIRLEAAGTARPYRDRAPHYHGRCFVTAFGVERLLKLPREQLDQLTLDDVGADVMRQLLKARPKP